MVTSRHKRTPRGPKSAPRGLPKEPQEVKIIDFSRKVLKDLGLLAFSVFRHSKTAQEAPKTAPRQPKSLPKKRSRRLKKAP
eukprot:8926174-Pyramimonas_sp.AAC.1